MTTILSWGNSQGEKGRCDAKCHNATTDPAHCKCMCGGAFHGIARNPNLEQFAAEHARELIAKARRLAASQGYELKTFDTVFQRHLPLAH